MRRRHRADLEGSPEHRWDAGLDDFVGERVPLVATSENPGGRLTGVIGADQAGLPGVEFAREAFGADLMGFEERAKMVVIVLCNRIEFVVVAASAPHR